MFLKILYWKIFKPQVYSRYKDLNRRYHVYGAESFIALLALKAPVHLNIYAPSHREIMLTKDHIL